MGRRAIPGRERSPCTTESRSTSSGETCGQIDPADPVLGDPKDQDQTGGGEGEDYRDCEHRHEDGVS